MAAVCHRVGKDDKILMIIIKKMMIVMMVMMMIIIIITEAKHKAQIIDIAECQNT
jgi:hypothetical protein